MCYNQHCSINLKRLNKLELVFLTINPLVSKIEILIYPIYFIFFLKFCNHHKNIVTLLKRLYVVPFVPTCETIET